MPYIPRDHLAALPRQPLATTAEKPPVPYMGSGANEANPLDRILGKKRMIERLSLEDWDVDPARIFTCLFGDKANGRK